ncbi:hypothetical protein Tco_0047549 [Tanacetum coccineum]
MADPSTELLVHKERPGDPGLPIVCHRKTWVTMIGPTLSLAGLSLPEKIFNLELKEEDSITDVENTIFDLGFMDSLCFSPVICGGETMSDSIFKHDHCKLVECKKGSGITYDCTRGTKSEREFEGNLQTHRALSCGSAFALTYFVNLESWPARDFLLLFLITDNDIKFLAAKSTGAILASNPPALAKQDKSNVGLVFEATTGSPIWSLVLEPHRRLDVFGAWLHRNGVAWKRYPSPKYRSSITIHDLVDQTHLVLEELERELGKVELEKSGAD